MTVDGPESSTAVTWPALRVRGVVQALDSVCDWHVNHGAHVVYRDLELRDSLAQA